MAEHWTDEEKDLLRWMYPSAAFPHNKILAQFPGRSLTAIRRQASRMNVAERKDHKPWTEEETQFMIDQYASTPMDEIKAALPDRNAGTIRAKAHRLGIVRQVRGNPWTAQEERTLRRLYPNANLTGDEIAAAIPGRTWGAIRKRANKLGLNRRDAGPIRRKRKKKPPARAKCEVQPVKARPVRDWNWLVENASVVEGD
jgi:hypothetical protein